MRAPHPIRRRTPRSVVVLLLLVILLPSVSLARSPSDSTATGKSDEQMPPALLPSTAEGRTVRVVLGARTLVCQSPRFTPAGIALPPGTAGTPGGTAPALLPWQEVDRIDVRGNSALTGAIIGGGAVALLAAAAGTAVASDEFLGQDTGAGDVLALTMMGAATGAVAGALVGLLVPSWKNVYRRGSASR